MPTNNSWNSPVPVTVAKGGTGASTLTQHGVIIGNSTSAVNVTSAGTTGQILTSNGAGSDPTFNSEVAFFAFLTNNLSNVTGDLTDYIVIFNTEAFDIGGNYDPATGIFTAPVTGKYRFTFNVFLSSIPAGATYSRLTIDTNSGFNRIYESCQMNPGAVKDGDGNLGLNINITADVNAGEGVRCRVLIGNSTKTVGLIGGATNPQTFFCGELIK